MSNIDKQALREAAEKAISEEGETWWNEEQLASDYGLALHRTDAKFIAAANPATVLALLDELEAAEKRIAELEARNLTIPDEIDFDHENEYGEHGGNGESWMRGRVQGFNEAVGKVKRNAIAAGISIKGEQGYERITE
ncbi:MAG: hypothetical protein [Bacteriophage sp.]|nr:MAG: hypothetical protein [Bacteriophage sp.]